MINAIGSRSPEAVDADPAWRGRLVENAVGAHLLNSLPPLSYNIHYWRRGNDEVDFVVADGSNLRALEIKSGRAGKTPGFGAFRRKFPDA